MYQFNEEESQQFISFFDAKPKNAKKTTELPVISKKVEARRVNMFGDSYKKNAEGQVTFFKYASGDVSYTFSYSHAGEVDSICGSNGWCWTVTDSGWSVSNCFDKWNVSKQDCEAVTVSESGIQASGDKPEAMGLPERR